MVRDLKDIELLAKISEFEIQRMNAARQGGRVNTYLIDMLTHDLEELRDEANKRNLLEGESDKDG